MRVPGSESKLTRRGLVAAGGGALAALLVGRSPARAAALLGADSPPPVARSPYRSRPDLQPPPITVATPASGNAPGYVFLSPFDITAKPGAAPIPPSQSHVGPLIVDSTGEPVWFLPLGKGAAMGLRVQRYRGKPVLTWFEGAVLGGYGGHYVVFDGTYHRVALVEAGGHGDLHEFLLTPKGTALLAIAATVPVPGGGPPIVEGVVQERAVDSGKVLFEWHSLDHVPVAESYRSDVTPDGNIDYFHLNSIDVDSDGSYLVSARHTSTVYKVDRRSGAILWRLGGKASDFSFADGAAFAFQHDARRQHDGTITLFDNGATGPGADRVEPASRPLRLRIDATRKTATLEREYVPEQPRSSDAMGNLQVLPDGGVFVGWGTVGGWTEFAPDGSVRFDASFADGRASYRVYRFPWRGVPDSVPAIALERTSAGLTAHVSWNGATEVAAWRLLGGRAPRALSRLAQARRVGFETSLSVPSAPAHVAVAALDVRGKELARTATILV